MNIAVILAGGVGSRLGLDRPKQFMKIAGKTVLEHTVEIFQRHTQIDEIAIVMHASYVHDVEEMVIKNHWTKVKKVLNGGHERYESSVVAINAYHKQAQMENINLIFHDAVRPLVSVKIISDIIKALNKFDAVDVAVPAVDTVIKLDETKKYIEQIPNRNYLNRGQTPQAFKYDVIAKAYQLALQDKNLQTTDDCGIVRKYLPDVKVYVIAGEEQNIKLTYPEDVYVLEKLFQIKGNVVGIVGTYNPDIFNLKYVDYSHLPNVHTIHELFAETKDDFDVLDYLVEQFDIFKKDELNQTLIPFIESLQKIFHMSFSEDTRLGLLIHMGCLIDRLQKKYASSVNFNINTIKEKYSKEYGLVSQSLYPLEEGYNVKLSDGDKATIIEIIINSKKEK